MLDGISNLNADSFMKKNYRMTKILCNTCAKLNKCFLLNSNISFPANYLTP